LNILVAKDPKITREKNGHRKNEIKLFLECILLFDAPVN